MTVFDWSRTGARDTVAPGSTFFDEARRDGVIFVLVLEDAVRCTPAILNRVYDVALEQGITRVTLCDTVGAASPAGTKRLIEWSARYFAVREHPVALEWHGHNDRGL